MGRRPSLSVWSLLARLCPGEAAPSLFSRSDERELGGPPSTVAELPSASHCEETQAMHFGLRWNHLATSWSTKAKNGESPVDFVLDKYVPSIYYCE